MAIKVKLNVSKLLLKLFPDPHIGVGKDPWEFYASEHPDYEIEWGTNWVRLRYKPYDLNIQVAFPVTLLELQAYGPENAGLLHAARQTLIDAYLELSKAINEQHASVEAKAKDDYSKKVHTEYLNSLLDKNGDKKGLPTGKTGGVPYYIIPTSSKNKPVEIVKMEIGDHHDPDASVKTVLDHLKTAIQKKNEETPAAAFKVNLNSTPLKSPSPAKMKVALKDATALGQKVAGASQTVIYKVVALHDDLKVAARLNEGRLSLRAEGPHIDELAQYQFKMKGEYADLHVELGKVDPAQVIVGLLAVMPVVFKEQVINRAGLKLIGI